MAWRVAEPRAALDSLGLDASLIPLAPAGLSIPSANQLLYLYNLLLLVVIRFRS